MLTTYPIYLCFPPIPTILSTSDSGSDFNTISNILTGEREASFNSTTFPATDPFEVVFDYGSPISPNYLFIAGFSVNILYDMFGDPLPLVINLYSSSDNSSWNLEYTKDASGLSESDPTRQGREKADFFVELSNMPSRRFWKFEIDYVVFEIRKLYLGKYFDLAADLNVGSSESSFDFAPEKSNAAKTFLFKAKSYKRTFELIWDGITDEKTLELLQLLRVSKRHYVVLINQVLPELFNNEKLLHSKIQQIQIERIDNNENNLTLLIEEMT